MTRLHFICPQAGVESDIPPSVLNMHVSDAVPIVLHNDRTSEGSRVTEIVGVEDLSTATPPSSLWPSSSTGARASPTVPSKRYSRPTVV